MSLDNVGVQVRFSNHNNLNNLIGVESGFVEQLSRRVVHHHLPNVVGFRESTKSSEEFVISNHLLIGVADDSFVRIFLSELTFEESFQLDPIYIVDHSGNLIRHKELAIDDRLFGSFTKIHQSRLSIITNRSDEKALGIVPRIDRADVLFNRTQLVLVSHEKNLTGTGSPHFEIFHEIPVHH